MSRRELKTAAPFTDLNGFEHPVAKATVAIDCYRVKNRMNYTSLKQPSILYRAGLAKRPFRLACDYRGDGFGTKGKSLKFMEEAKFSMAWDRTAAAIYTATGQKVPDIRWRAHIAVWAAARGMSLDGDFVECGVHTGILSGVICRYFDFARSHKQFWLFDTWGGVPTGGISEAERKVADGFNRDYHQQDIYNEVRNSFSAFPNCRFIRGMLPGTLAQASIDKIAYLSMDLNNATYEKSSIEALWDRLLPGAVVLLDDYNFAACRLQQDMWDKFAHAHGNMIASLPTGQGLLLR